MTAAIVTEKNNNQLRKLPHNDNAKINCGGHHKMLPKEMISKQQGEGEVKDNNNSALPQSIKQLENNIKKQQ